MHRKRCWQEPWWVTSSMPRAWGRTKPITTAAELAWPTQMKSQPGGSLHSPRLPFPALTQPSTHSPGASLWPCGIVQNTIYHPPELHLGSERTVNIFFFFLYVTAKQKKFTAFLGIPQSHCPVLYHDQVAQFSLRRVTGLVQKQERNSLHIWTSALHIFSLKTF